MTNIELQSVNMNPQDIAEQLNKEWLQGAGAITQMPGKADASTQKFYSNHKGFDFGVKAGTPLKANKKYQVIGAGLDNTGYGNRVGLYDPESNRTTYLSHLSKILVDKGVVNPGTVIGYTGGRPGTYGAGNTTGEHLDAEIYEGNKPLSFSMPSMYSNNNYNAKSGNYSQNLIQSIKQKYGNTAIAISKDPNKLKDLARKKGGKIVKVQL